MEKSKDQENLESEHKAMDICLKLGYPNPNAQSDIEFIRFANDYFNNANLKNAPTASINHETGIIEIPNGGDKGTPEWHKRNIKIIEMYCMLEIAQTKRYMIFCKIGISKVKSHLSYAESKYASLMKSVEYLKNIGEFDADKPIYVKFVLLEFIQMLKKKYRVKLFFYNIFNHFRKQ